MRINIGFESSYDVIEFEDFLGSDVEEYKKAFEIWYFEVDYTYGVPILRQCSTLKYKYFNVETFLDWLNEVAPNCNARIIEKDIEFGHEDKTIPYICF